MEDTYEPAPVHRRGPGRQLMALRQMGERTPLAESGLDIHTLDTGSGELAV